MALGTDGEGQDPAQDEERLERPEGRPGVDLDALDAGDERPVAGHDPGDQVAVAAEELRRRFGDEVRPELERPADVRRGERVVDDVHRAVPVGELGEGRVVGKERRRVGDGLGVEDAGRRGGERRGHRVEVGRVDDVDRDAETAERPEELLARRSVCGDRRHDPVAGPHQRGKRGVDGGHPRRQRDARPPRRRAPRRRSPSALVVGFEMRL